VEKLGMTGGITALTAGGKGQDRQWLSCENEPLKTTSPARGQFPQRAVVEMTVYEESCPAGK
jgi:hypothetical protein